MTTSLRTKLLLSFLIVIGLSGLVTTWVGVRLIGDEIIRRAQDKVRIDLNSAREIYNQRLERVREVVRLTGIRFFVRDGLIARDADLMMEELENVRRMESLDVLTITDEAGVVLFRTRNPMVHGDSQIDDEIVKEAISSGKVVASTEIVPREDLLREGGNLAEQARMRLIPTPKARPRPKAEETSGMMIKAAAPVFDLDGSTIGVLYGGKLLNRSFETVDQVKDVVYRGEKYKGKDTGTATIFQGDLRISTNVRRSDDERALGTRVSKEVYDQVIGQGIPWIARAFVVNDWYITAYEPIRSIRGEIIGMLYVGMLEAPYVDVRNRVVLTFLGIAVLTLVVLSVVVYFITSSIISPLRDLLYATRKIAKGNLEHRVAIKSRDEIGQLSVSFNRMTKELQKATDRYLQLTRTLEDKVRDKTKELKEAQAQLVQTAKMSSLGKLAAGIAHEINNPLTSILINSHLIAERLKGSDELDDNITLIIDETTRCGGIVKGLLEFSRQTTPEKKVADVNKVIEETLLLMRSHVLVSGVTVERNLSGDIPPIMIDINKVKQVFTNVILNAMEAMTDTGKLTVRSRLSSDGRYAELEFEDTGCGIPKDMVAKIFDPFFTTKGVGGTGLGLSITYGIVEQHDGKIDVHSEEGRGTTVTIRLPVTESAID
jgi:two-component system NtrC family sensor kinase